VPTIIDSLVVQLTLDPSAWLNAKQRVDESVAKTREGVRRGATEWEELAKRGDQFIRTLQTQALKLASIFLGGLGIEKVLSSFAQVDSAAGRTARYLQMPVEVLSQWENAARTVGAAEGEITQSFQNLKSELTRFQMGLPAPAIGVLRALLPGVNPLGMSPDQIFRMIAEQRASLNPARLAEFMSMIGAGRAGLDLVSLGGSGLSERLRQAREVGVLTAEQARHAAEMQNSWAQMELAALHVGRIMADWASPTLVQMFNTIRDILKVFDAAGFLNRAQSQDVGSLTGNFATAVWGALNKRTFGEAWEYLTTGGRGGGPAGTFPGFGGGGVRTKAGAGTASPAMEVLAAMIQSNVPGVDRFTAFDDALHAHRGAHGQGRALDFTLKDPSQSAAVSERIREQLRAAGVDGRVIDEYLHPSPGATGGHIHVQLSQLAASRMASRGAGGGASVSIGTVNVTSTAADFTGVAHDAVRGAFQDAAMAAQANTGMQ
jgi:hypothetical protein